MYERGFIQPLVIGIVLLAFVVGGYVVVFSKDNTISTLVSKDTNTTRSLAEDKSVTLDEQNTVSENDVSVEVKVTGSISNSPGGCTTQKECDIYFKNSPDESRKWCLNNPKECAVFSGENGATQIGPGGCANDCETYCSSNQQECQLWCADKSNRESELCAYIKDAPEGDGVWKKSELTFYIKDENNTLSSQKRETIKDAITSNVRSGTSFWGWNVALAELNNLYPQNLVPDKIIETDAESSADIVISVFTEKEFCCDLGGDPVRGIERSKIDSENTKIRSDINIYNIINIETGFLGDVARHELGHMLGIFGHTNRLNDLMSLTSPASTIGRANLQDLYEKYKNFVPSDIETERRKEEGIEKVAPPS